MENVRVYSPVEDKKIAKNIKDSLIWVKAYTEEEYKKNLKTFNTWYRYSIKFDGLKPVQVTNIRKF